MSVPYEVFGEAAAFLAGLPADERARVDAWVEAHEAPLRDDCSDGPTVALEHEAEAMEDETYSCCGWTTHELVIAGRTLVVGTCHGH